MDTTNQEKLARAAAEQWFCETKSQIKSDRARTGGSYADAALVGLELATQKLAAIILSTCSPEQQAGIDAQAEIKAAMDLLPGQYVVRSRPEGGKENVYESLTITLAKVAHALKSGIDCPHWDTPPEGTAIYLLDKMARALSTLTSQKPEKDIAEVWDWFWQLDARMRTAHESKVAPQEQQAVCPGCGHARKFFYHSPESGDKEPRCWHEDADGLCGHECVFPQEAVPAPGEVAVRMKRGCIEAFDREIARQAEFGLYPSAEDFRMALQWASLSPKEPLLTAPSPQVAIENPIEAALIELRGMFPDLQIIVSIRDCGEETMTPRGTTLEYSVQVGMNGEEFHADTLKESMAQVREWEAQQQ